MLVRALWPGSRGRVVLHWWIQRVTAVALVPLALWLTASLIALAGAGYGAFLRWFKAPLTVILMILLLSVLFQHMAAGLQVVIEDYVHVDRTRVAAVRMMRWVCLALAVAGILATLRVAFAT